MDHANNSVGSHKGPTRNKGAPSLQFVNCTEKGDHAVVPMKSSTCFGRGKKLPFSPLWILIELFIFFIVAIPVALFFFVIPPHRLGFFCDDKTIQYPYRPDTITTTSLLVVGLLTPAVVMFGVEFLNQRRKTLMFGSNNRILDAIKAYAIFFFGGMVNQMFVEIGKSCLGRLRPHFIDVCRPDFTKINCSIGYVTDYTCTNTKYSSTILKDTHLSFPSGHAAFGTYCALYALFYIQLRFHMKRTHLLKPSVQLALVSLNFYGCVTRVTDFKHHPSDVFGGIIIGVLTASLVFFKMTCPMLKSGSYDVMVDKNENSRRPNLQHLDSVMTTVSSCPSDMGSDQCGSDDSSDVIIQPATPTPLLSKENIV